MNAQLTSSFTGSYPTARKRRFNNQHALRSLPVGSHFQKRVSHGVDEMREQTLVKKKQLRAVWRTESGQLVCSWERVKVESCQPAEHSWLPSGTGF